MVENVTPDTTIEGSKPAVCFGIYHSKLFKVSLKINGSEGRIHNSLLSL